GALLWALLAADKVPGDLSGTVLSALEAAYQSGGRRSAPSAAERKEIVTAVKPRAEAGPEIQRAVALALLYSTSREDAAPVAAKVVADAKTPPELRQDALQIHLMSLTTTEATRVAVAGLAKPNPA